MEQVPVRKHRALGPARRAGGIDDHREVGLRAFGKGWALDFGHWALDPRFLSLQLLDSEQLQVWPGNFQRTVMRAEFGIRDEHVDARVAQNVIHLVGLEEIVDRHDHRPGAQDAKQRRDELRAVLKPQPYAVTGSYLKLMLELIRDQDGFAPQFGIGILAFAPKQGDFLRLPMN